MKKKIAVALAAFSVAVTSTVAVAGPPEKGGHYEWRSAPQPGPNKSNLPNVRRVWVADTVPEMAMSSQACAEMACCKHDSAA